jgi:hypothetical protein
VLLLLTAVPAAAQRYTVTEAALDGGGGLVQRGSLTLVSSLSAIPVGTVQTDRYVLYSGLPSPFAGQAAILIIHDPTAAGPAEEGVPRGVTARIVTNNAPLASATLYYRVGPSAEPTALDMTADETGFVATIPGTAVGADGLTYYFVAVDEAGATTRAPRRGVYSLPVRLGDAGLRRPEPQAGGTTQAAYRLLSIPIVLDDPSPEAVLGDDIPTLASASAYDTEVARLFEPIGTRVAEYPGTGDFELGRAFWLIVRETVEALDAGAGTVGPLNEPVDLRLSEGWNFIGTPFTTAVPVENLRAASGAALTLRSYGADGYNTPDAPVAALQPFAGYAVFVEAATTLTVQPPGGEDAPAATTARTAARPAFPWRLRIRGTARGGGDADNVAAVHADAADGWDARDWPEPPAMGSGLRIAFDAPAGGPADVALSADVRSPGGRGHTWPFTVATDAAGPVRLSVEGVEQLPGTVEAWLVDPTTKASWDLRASPRVRLEVLADGATRPMTLVVGTSAYVQERLRDLEALALEYALHPPSPNPSAGPVALQLDLPEDDQVTVEVYNILGQRVALLKDGEPMAAGVHTVVWDAPRLASGLYFVRMHAGAYRKTQKLVRVR